jgi:hypothetical protein
MGVVNSWGASGATAQTVAITVSPAAGNYLVVFSMIFDGTLATAGLPTDNVGSTYVRRGTDTVWSSTFRSIISIATLEAIPSGITTVTIHGNAGTNEPSGAIFELSGAPSGGFDTASTNEQTSSTPGAGAITTAQAEEVLLVALTHDGVTTTLTPPSGFTAGPEVESATNNPFSSGYQVVHAVQTGVNPTWQNAASLDCSLAIIAIKQTAAAGPAFVPHRMPLGV